MRHGCCATNLTAGNMPNVGNIFGLFEKRSSRLEETLSSLLTQTKKPVLSTLFAPPLLLAPPDPPACPSQKRWCCFSFSLNHCAYQYVPRTGAAHVAQSSQLLRSFLETSYPTSLYSPVKTLFSTAERAYVTSFRRTGTFPMMPGNLKPGRDSRINVQV
eukprot:TRINITY_DN24553_c0_g1_i1.p1 TRINITY_DN24553_c0_g1~~TRINITY_DN24553_c0_g1_i1.p1  ORF type:complete len:159 (-),score=4.42 TRINITY_DN24553_c0_g1_i1:53-529(-)